MTQQTPNRARAAGIVLVLLMLVPVELALIVLAISHTAQFCAGLIGVLVIMAALGRIRRK